MNNLTELKTLIVTIFGLLASLFSPILDFMLAMLILLSINLFFGVAAAVTNGEKWSWKKASMFIVFCASLFFCFASIFAVGHFLHQDAEAALCVKYVCFIAVWVFGTNIIKNWRKMLVEGTATYRFVDILYYCMTVQFVEKLPWIKKYNQEKQEEQKQL
jgi:predicted lysophospholipase L1 biosynthesis ABC-type transport system permease subunit